MLRIEAQGASVAYRKMWLSDEEARRFTPGPEPAVIEVEGFRLGLAVCKDTGIAEHAAATTALQIDAYAAGVLDSADEAVTQEQRAARVTADHRVWVVIASFAGATGGRYQQTATRSRITGRTECAHRPGFQDSFWIAILVRSSVTDDGRSALEGMGCLGSYTRERDLRGIPVDRSGDCHDVDRARL